MAIDGDLTSDAGVEVLISWHREEAEFWEHKERLEAVAEAKKAFYRTKMRHLTTAELLAELLRLRDAKTDYYTHRDY